ncbi:MAG: glycosyltransferase [Candidatus Methanomethyliaceae archaeon]
MPLGKYAIVARLGKGLFSVAGPRLIQLAFMHPYDVMVLPPMDSPGELVDNLICFISARLRRKPFMVFSERWFYEQLKVGIIRKIYRMFDFRVFAFCAKRAQICIACGGSKQIEYFKRCGVEEQKLVSVPYISNVVTKAMSESALRRGANAIRSELELGGAIVVMCVARLVMYKGSQYLLEAIKKVSVDHGRTNVRLVIVGGGDYYDSGEFYGEELENLSITLGISRIVRFVGFIDSNELCYYYYMCDLLVYPSIAITFADTGCLPVSDAMFFSKPVIATDAVGYAHDLVRDGFNGFLVPPRDSDAICKAIIKTIESKERCKEMGRNSKRLLEERGFTFEMMVSNFNGAVSAVMGSRSHERD